MSHLPPEIPVTEARRSLWQRASIVWLVPLSALLIALGVAWQSYHDRGPLIEVSFEEAKGIHAGETELRYRDVTVGLVEEVSFADDLRRVNATIRVDKTIADYIDDDARFWIVTPQVTAQGVSGLDTVLSGVFIEAVWDSAAEGLSLVHEGQDEAPLLRPGEEGITMELRALPGATLTDSTPILYKNIPVGRIGKPQITNGGEAAVAQAVIYAPYDRLITTATRFWDASGFSFSLGPQGVRLNFDSVSSLLTGGVAFETLASGGIPITDSTSFQVFAAEKEARESLFNDNSQPGVNVTIIFEDNVSGLDVGAPVELGGLVIGEVVSLTGVLDPLRFRDDRVRLMVNVELRPGQLGLGDETGEEQVLTFLDTRIENGLRARLTTASILTGGLKIELVEIEDAEQDRLDYTGTPFPIMPSSQAQVSDTAATAQGVFQRLNNLPIEELLDSAIGFLNTATALTADPDLTQVPADVRALLGDVRGLVGSDEVQALPVQVASLITTISDTTTDLRRIAQSLEEAQAVDRLLAAVDAAGSAATTVSSSFDGVPELIQSLNNVAHTAETLPLDSLVAQATGVVSAAETLLRDDGLQALPEQLGAALDEIRAALGELRDGGAVENLNATFSSAQEAAAAIQDAAGRLPEITRRLDTVMVQANKTLAGLEPNSELNRAARGALTEVERAARAVESLARALERRPNSLILGR